MLKIQMKVAEKSQKIQMKVAETDPMVEMKPDEGSGVFHSGDMSTYAQLPDKPRINGVVLQGDRSLSDIGIGSIPLAEIAEMFKDW